MLRQVTLWLITFTQYLSHFKLADSSRPDLLRFLGLLLRLDIYAVVHDRACDPIETDQAFLAMLHYEANPSGITSNPLAYASSKLLDLFDVKPEKEKLYYTLPENLSDADVRLLQTIVVGAEILKKFIAELPEPSRYTAVQSSPLR